MRTDDAGTRARQAALVNMRQQLLAPGHEIIGWISASLGRFRYRV